LRLKSGLPGKRSGALSAVPTGLVITTRALFTKVNEKTTKFEGCLLHYPWYQVQQTMV